MNGRLKPSNFSYGSNKSVYWKCNKCQNSYSMRIANRTLLNMGCPYCAGKKIKEGFNDISTTNSDLCDEWDYSRNSILPTEVSKGSDKKVWWKCSKCGNSWCATISSRNRSGCPYCSGRKVKAGYNDLFTTHSKLCNEWDYSKNTIMPTDVTNGSNKKVWWKCNICGGSWYAVISSRLKNGCPYCGGKKVNVGFNDLLTTHIELCKEWDYSKNTLLPTEVSRGSMKKVWWKCSKCGNSWCATVGSRSKSGCPYCSGKKVKAGYNDLLTTHSELCKEWDYSMNTILPTEVSKGSEKKVWWKCSKCGNGWCATVNSRIKSGCPYCAGVKVKAGFNDLITTHSELCKEWDYSMNTILPTEVSMGSNKKVWWKCSKCGNNWYASVTKRRITGCPYCAGTTVKTGFNDLLTTHGELCQEWDYSKNVILPTEVSKGSTKKIWWKCSVCGGSWNAVIYSRTNPKHKTGCPYCAGKIPHTIENDVTM